MLRKILIMSLMLITSSISHAQFTTGDAVSYVLDQNLDSPTSLGSTLGASSSLGNKITDESQGSDRFMVHQKELSQQGLVIYWDIPSGHYLYRDQFAVSWGEDSDVSVSWAIEEGVPYQDEFFGDVEIYRHGASAIVGFDGLAERPEAVTVSFQGCSDKGICFPPESTTLALDWSQEVAQGAEYTKLLDASGGMREAETTLWERHLGWLLGAFLLMGLGLSLTPCVLPMLPVVSAMIMGSEKRAARGLTLTLMYVLGMITIYAGMGGMVASFGSGSTVQAWMRHPVVVSSFATVILLMGLVTMGVLRWRDGGISQRVSEWQSRLPTHHPLGAYVLGMLATLILSPCVTGPLAGVLLYIATTGDIMRGTLSLASLALGMGIPLLVIGALGRHVIPRPGVWMDFVKRLMGWVLIGVAVWLLGEILPSFWYLALVGVILALAVADWWHWHLRNRPIAKRFGVLVALLALGSWLVMVDQANEVAFYHYPKVTEQTALQEVIDASDEALLVKVTADWCMICKVMDREIFQNRELMEAYHGEVVYFDVTAMKEDQRDMMAAHHIFGPPALLFYEDGQLQDRFHGNLSESEFRERYFASQRQGRVAGNAY